MARFEQVQAHRPSHQAKADESNFAGRGCGAHNKPPDVNSQLNSKRGAKYAAKL
jgi:hypothetical protein